MAIDDHSRWRVHVSEPLNAETLPAALATPGPTPVDAFFVRSHGAVPAVDPAAWRLRVDGLVDTPLTLSLADLRARYGRRAVTATLQCAGNRRTALLAIKSLPG